ncbi:FAD-dependent oxidoreductase [Alkalimarinus alittae]|uniref:FAD-binding oxidoreductase n=1 Tax=Alkalimarinus alittae TaxID=2961619 RepID=A0ABY6MZS8_9ALTE|nr:FAD-dependent oxidoreductase [Alkalimarinus alittae]UZE95348.1 FAD-binding oxidoreductase [Alkalimarinus alittae]
MIKTDPKTSTSTPTPRIGIVGGGMAGSTVALRLAELGINVVLFEAGKTLVNGPPICHLHAGGNLYRDISDEQCITLLRQSIDTLRVYPQTANIRPTVIAIPARDSGSPNDLLPRLKKLQTEYAALITQDPKNNVLGAANDYFKLYDRHTLEALAKKETPKKPLTLDDWMIPVAKNLNLDEFKLPLVLVQEYGLSIFRIASTVSLALDQLKSCTVLTSTNVTHIQYQQKQAKWKIEYQSEGHPNQSVTVDYLINACGYRTGMLDDMLDFKRNRMVEFKAAYIAHWSSCQGEWPEVIFHGERGTPDGMAQLTPYPDGYFQLHGMTNEITLFKEGLVASTEQSAQPMLNSLFNRKLTDKWKHNEIERRTAKAIEHVAQFIPRFKSATVGGNPMFGAQQIPGDDPSLRAADVSFAGRHYARAEIVKASSALTVANAIIDRLKEESFFTSEKLFEPKVLSQQFPVTNALPLEQVTSLAENLAKERDYPPALARAVGSHTLK